MSDEIKLHPSWLEPLRGQFEQPYARRTNIAGVLAAPVMLFWNIEKK